MIVFKIQFHHLQNNFRQTQNEQNTQSMMADKKTYRLTTDLLRLFSKALRSEGSSRVRRSLLAFGWNSWRGWEGWEGSVAADSDKPNRSWASVQSKTTASQFQAACSCWSTNAPISVKTNGLGVRLSAGNAAGSCAILRRFVTWGGKYRNKCEPIHQCPYTIFFRHLFSSLCNFSIWHF